MRFLAIAALLVPLTASAQSISGSGALGAGAISEGPVSVVDLGVDVAAETWSFGVGGRLRFAADGTPRKNDWDEAGEVLHIVRYAEWSHNGTFDVAAVAGDLYAARLGTGELVDGFSTGLNIDHRPLAADVGVQFGDYRARLVLDNVARPQLVAAHAERRIDRHYGVSLSSANDLRAPRMDGAGLSSLAALSAWTQGAGAFGWGRLSLTAAAHLGEGGGLHLGLAAGRGDSQAGVSLRSELSIGSDNYLPGYFHGLYQVTRQRLSEMRGSQLEEVRAQDLAGLGAAASARIYGRYGDVSAGLRHRPGMPVLASARLSLPRFRLFQFGAAITTEWSSRPVTVLGAELRFPLPLGLFGAAELSRQYQDDEGGQSGVWFAMAALGASIGE